MIGWRLRGSAERRGSLTLTRTSTKTHPGRASTTRSGDRAPGCTESNTSTSRQKTACTAGSKHLRCQHRPGQARYTGALSSTPRVFFFIVFWFFLVHPPKKKEEIPVCDFQRSPCAPVAAGGCIWPKRTSPPPGCGSRLPAGTSGAAGTSRSARRGGMAASARWVLCLGWGCLCLALGDALQARWDGLRRQAAPGGVRSGRPGAAAGDCGPGQWQEPEERRRPERLQPGDKVSEHMLRLYDQYSGGRVAAAQPLDLPGPPGLQLRHGNTVRGFRPRAAGESQRRVWGDSGSSACPRNRSTQSCRGSRPAAGPGLPKPQGRGTGRARLLPRSSQSRSTGEVKAPGWRAWPPSSLTQAPRQLAPG